MKLLSIDASGKTTAVAISENNQIIAEEFLNSGLTHSQTLLPLVDKTLKKACIDIKDIDEFAVTSGPGSFTGLRIGMALVMGLCNSKPCRPVPSLKALAYNLINEDGIIVPVMDARRNQVYTSLYRCENQILTQLEPDMAISVDEVLERIEKYKDLPIWILGDGAYLFEGKSPYIKFPSEDLLYIKGSSITYASKDITAIDAKQLKITYLRLSQAERELKERTKK